MKAHPTPRTMSCAVAPVMGLIGCSVMPVIELVEIPTGRFSKLNHPEALSLRSKEAE